MDPKNIEVELVKANVTDEVIGHMEHSYTRLTVRDVYDKEGYELVVNARKMAREFRLAAVALLKEIRQPALEFQKAVVDREKTIVDRVKAVEAHLKAQEAVFKAESLPAPEGVPTDEDLVRRLRDAIIAIPMPTVTSVEAKRVVDAIRVKLTEAILIK